MHRVGPMRPSSGYVYVRLCECVKARLCLFVGEKVGVVNGGNLSGVLFSVATIKVSPRCASRQIVSSDIGISRLHV